MAGELVWVGGMSRTLDLGLCLLTRKPVGVGGGGGATPVGFRFIRFFSWGGLSGSVEGGSYANRPQISLWFFHLPSEQLLGGVGGGGVGKLEEGAEPTELTCIFGFSHLPREPVVASV